jgi:hypothetical protein
MAIQIGGSIVVDNDRNYNAGIATFTALDYPISINVYSPSIGQTSVGIDTNIVLTFNQQIEKGTGNITIREGSSGGVAIQTVGVTSTSVTISGFQAIIDLPSNLGFSTTYYPVIDAGAFKGTSSPSVGRSSSELNTYYFTTQPFTVAIASLGDTIEGGELICKSGGTAWIVAPSSSEVSRNWYCRNNAVTTAQQVSGCTGWFIPSISQLQNPGYICRQYWDSYASDIYWSSSQYTAFHAVGMNFGNGNTYNILNKACPRCVRAFRCVTY